MFYKWWLSDLLGSEKVHVVKCYSIMCHYYRHCFMIETAWWLSCLQSMLVTISIRSPKHFLIYVCICCWKVQLFWYHDFWLLPLSAYLCALIWGVPATWPFLEAVKAIIFFLGIFDSLTPCAEVINKTGPIIVPCGTPTEFWWYDDIWLQCFTRWCLSARKLLTTGFTAGLNSSFSIARSGRMQSKALLKSGSSNCVAIVSLSCM